jgi:Protein of unknown function (DUF3047)
MRNMIAAGIAIVVAVCALYWLMTPAPPPANARRAPNPQQTPEPQPPADDASDSADAVRALVFAFDGEVDEQGIPDFWQLHCSTGKAELAVQPDPENSSAQVLWVKSNKASFFLARNAADFDPAEYPILEWSWQGKQLPVGGDVRKSSLNPFAENKNDQVLQLLVTFDNRDVISYMWDTTAPVGTEVKESNPFANIMSVVVESGEERLGQWCHYRRNVADDYRRLHGGTLRKIRGIAVQTNSNHTGTIGEGSFGQIRFRQEPAAGN